MTELIVICRNKKQAKNLYERTCTYYCFCNHPYICDRNKLIVKDTVFRESVRFITLYELKHKNFEDGLSDLRITGDFFDKWLDGRIHLLPIYNTFVNHIKNYIIDGYLHMR